MRVLIDDPQSRSCFEATLKICFFLIVHLQAVNNAQNLKLTSFFNPQGNLTSQSSLISLPAVLAPVV